MPPLAASAARSRDYTRGKPVEFCKRITGEEEGEREIINYLLLFVMEIRQATNIRLLDTDFDIRPNIE